MTFTELAKDIGQDREVILEKLEIVFGVKPNLEDEITYDFEKVDLDENKMSDNYIGDEDGPLFAVESYEKLFEHIDTDKIEKIELLENKRDEIFNINYAERRYQIICMYWYGLWLREYGEDESSKLVLKKLEDKIRKYSSNTFANAKDCDVAFRTFFKRNTGEVFVEIQKYFEKYMYSDDIYYVPDVCGLSKEQWKRINYINKWKNIRNKKLGKTDYYENAMKALERLIERANRETNAIAEEIDNLFGDYCDDVYGGLFKKTDKKYDISKNEFCMIKYICEIVSTGKVCRTKLINGEWESFPLEVRDKLYSRMMKVVNNVNSWNRYIRARTRDDLIDKSAKILMRIRHPYCEKIIDDIEAITDFWEEINKLEFEEENYVKLYGLLEKVICEMNITKKPRLEIEDKTKTQIDDEFKKEEGRIKKYIKDAIK